MPFPRRLPPPRIGTATVFWLADSWLPSEYKKAGFVVQAMRYALSKQGLRCDRIMACFNPTLFPDDLLERYHYTGVYTVYASDSERENLKEVLANLVSEAWDKRGGRFVVVTKLSQHNEMVTRVLGSLIHRGFDVILVVPVVDEPNNFGIYRTSNVSTLEEPEPEPGSKSLPVWVCPLLFDESLPVYPKTAEEGCELELERLRRKAAGEQDEDEDDKYFMQLPAPQITTFSMPTSVTTSVFWDVKDFPIPQGLDPDKFFENIKSAVCSYGDLSIYAYGVAEELDSLPPSYLHAGITFVKAPADQVSRATVMLVDIVLWSMDNSWRRPPLVSNILVISKDDVRSPGMFGAVLEGLQFRRCCKVFLALPHDDLQPPSSYENSVLPWETLSAREKKRKTREEEYTVSASHG